MKSGVPCFSFLDLCNQCFSPAVVGGAGCTVERQCHLPVSSSKNVRKRRLEEVISPISFCSTHLSKPQSECMMRVIVVPPVYGESGAGLKPSEEDILLEMYCNCCH